MIYLFYTVQKRLWLYAVAEWICGILVTSHKVCTNVYSHTVTLYYWMEWLCFVICDHLLIINTASFFLFVLIPFCIHLR